MFDVGLNEVHGFPVSSRPSSCFAQHPASDFDRVDIKPRRQEEKIAPLRTPQQQVIDSGEPVPDEGGFSGSAVPSFPVGPWGGQGESRGSGSVEPIQKEQK